MNRKGDITDILIFAITVFILMIGFFILAFVVPEITGGLEDAGMNGSSEGANAIDRLSDFGTITIQRGTFLLFIGLIASMMITSFFARTHPIFLFLYMIVTGLTVFLAVYLGNAYEQMTSIDVFSNTLASQTLINLVMNHILTIILVVGALGMIIIFAKFSSGSGGGQQI